MIGAKLPAIEEAVSSATMCASEKATEAASKRLAVVEGDPRPELDFVGRRVAEIDRLGEEQLDLSLRAVLEEGIVDGVDDRPAVVLIGRRRVEGGRFGAEVDHQLVHLCRRLGRQAPARDGPPPGAPAYPESEAEHRAAGAAEQTPPGNGERIES